MHRLGIEPGSISQNSLEVAFERTGFVISRAEMLGSELIEFYEERDGRASRELMRIARMRRRREELMTEWGRLRYDTAHALYQWVIYLLLGKLSAFRPYDGFEVEVLAVLLLQIEIGHAITHLRAEFGYIDLLVWLRLRAGGRVCGHRRQ